MNHPQTPITILLDAAPKRAMEAHALSSPKREVMGVMIGPLPQKQPDGYYVVEIQEYIEARYTIGTDGSVRIPAESWRYVNAEMARRRPGHLTRMLGWFHTHPRLGIFLSDPDLFIHCNFFKEIWQIALVLDPAARSAGFFAWDVEKRAVVPHEFVWHWGR